MEHLELANIMGMLATAFPRFKLEKNTVEVYYRLLGDLPADLLEAAAIACACQKDFFPSVHELREASVDIQRRISKIPTAYEAWHEINSNPRWIYCRDPETGEVTRSPRIPSHPFVTKVAMLLGYPNFPGGESEAVDRAHFTRAYEEQLRMGLSEATQLPQINRYIERKQTEGGLPKLLSEVIHENLRTSTPQK